jgi:renalase
MKDVAIIGAGMAGLVCAQQLSQAGYSVLVVEKSRGLGGRVATRRLHDTFADHGACYLKPKDELMTQFVELLCHHDVLKVWEGVFIEKSALSDGITSEPTGGRYIAPQGMSSIAKFLAQGLNILLNQRVIAINQTPEKWCLTLEQGNEEITAKALVIAIPAPQAFFLLQPLASIIDTKFLNKLASVEYFPSLSVMAGYSSTCQPLPEWNAVTLLSEILVWIGYDSSKRINASQPIFVVQSNLNFAQTHLETPDLQPVGQQMLQVAADAVKFPWLSNPEWMQVHRWRYAFPKNPLEKTFLTAETSLLLVCCGDWCGGNLIAGAMHSGIAAANQINSQLDQHVINKSNFLNLRGNNF